jgi:hypothetical protein
MSTESLTAVNPVAKLYRDAYTLGVEHHSTSQMPTPYENFEKAYTADIEFMVPIKELYSVYRKGYRKGAPVIADPVTYEDVATMSYTDKILYIKADPRYLYVGANGFIYKALVFTDINKAYLYTKSFLENGGD